MLSSVVVGYSLSVVALIVVTFIFVYLLSVCLIIVLKCVTP